MSDNKAYAKITNRIITLLEKGVIPWERGWHRGEAPHNPYTPTHYRGINALSLLGTMIAQEWDDPRFATFKQIKQAGGHVLKGSTGTHVLYYVPVLDRNTTIESSDGQKIHPVKFMVPKAYTVFNLATQAASIDLDPLAIPHHDFNPIEICEQIITGYVDAPPITNDGRDRAFYRPTTDSIHMPKHQHFKSDEDYYSTLFHEIVHSTGHASRLNRDGITTYNPFGSKGYAKEELIAEIGASMLCGHAGIDANIENSAAYIGGWLKALNDDKTLIVKAASSAETAVNYIQGVDSQ